MTLRGPTTVLFIFLLLSSPSFAQQTQVIYPNGLIAIAAKPLPRKVYEAQKNILEIRVRLFYPNRPSVTIGAASGSGFVEKTSGYIVTARHVLIETMINLMAHQVGTFYIDKNGLPQGTLYETLYNYEFKAILYTATGELEYPLELKAIGPMGTHSDVMILKSFKPIPVQGLELEYKAKPGDTVYASGFTNYRTHYHNSRGQTATIQLDSRIKYNFESTILAVLENNATKSASVKRAYRLAGGVDFGFSGGPTLNTLGQAIGITNQTDGYFSYATSAQDIDALIRSVK